MVLVEAQNLEEMQILGVLLAAYVIKRRALTLLAQDFFLYTRCLHDPPYTATSDSTAQGINSFDPQVQRPYSKIKGDHSPDLTKALFGCAGPIPLSHTK